MKKQVKSIKKMQENTVKIVEKQQLFKVKGGFTIEDEIVM